MKSCPVFATVTAVRQLVVNLIICGIGDMCKLITTRLLLCLWGGVFTAQVFAATINSVRMWPAPDSTRLVFDLSGPVQHSLFSLKSPNRLVIDLKNARLSHPFPAFNYSNSFIKNIRHARRNRSDIRVVLDLKSRVRPKSFLLKPNSEYGHRLVIDLLSEKQQRYPVKSRRQPTYKHRNRDIIVAIDAGHGGDDPGAIGPHGTREKYVVMAIARKLKAMLNRERGMRPIMIRKGDYYVGLKNRVKLARKNQADILISLHADAFRNSRARGTSVFVLSERGASSQAAKFLAESENRADMIGGVDLDEIDDDLLRLVIVDMVKNNTMGSSHKAARYVLSSLKNVTRLHKRHVEQAGFRVLKAPDIPSILVETAFISNYEEERKLRSPKHQRRIARAILKGVRGYFRSNPLPGTLLASKGVRHRVVRGETLSAIAVKYRVSVASIRSMNKLRSDRLKAGAVLQIPQSS